MHKNTKIDTPQKLIAANVPPEAQIATNFGSNFSIYFRTIDSGFN